MNLNATRVRLEMLMRELARSWEETQNGWRDAKAAEFDRQYMQELAAQVDKAATVMEKLNGLLTRMKDDCD